MSLACGVSEPKVGVVIQQPRSPCRDAAVGPEEEEGTG